jgi:acetyl esterase/lipase
MLDDVAANCRGMRIAAPALAMVHRGTPSRSAIVLFVCASAALVAFFEAPPRGQAPHARHARAQPQPPPEPDDPVEPSFGAARDAFAAPECGPLADARAPILERRDLVYAVLGGRTLRLDLARPAKGGASPVVILVHGGGFRGGDKRDLEPLMRALASRGFAAAAVSYRLLGRGEDRFPAGIADVRCAARYLAAHDEELDIDAERMAAIGFSAGGHLASSMAWQSDVRELDGGCPYDDAIELAGVVAFYPPLDFRPEVPWGPAIRFLLRRVLDDGTRSLAELVRLASPVAYADRRDAPVLLVHGTDDDIIPIERSREAVRLARRAGAMTDLLEAAGLPHGFGIEAKSAGFAPICATLAFLDATLRGRPTQP